MRTLPNIDEKVISDVLLNASSANNYRFEFAELGSVLRHTIRKASGDYVDTLNFAVLLQNELRDYVMRQEINDKERREARRCS